MSTTPTAIAADQAKFLPRVRGFLGAALFLALRRFPRLLQLHRNESSWALFRFALASLGAAVFVLPFSFWNGWVHAIFCLVFFVVAIPPPPAGTESSTHRQARAPGARNL